MAYTMWPAFCKGEWRSNSAIQILKQNRNTIARAGVKTKPRRDIDEKLAPLARFTRNDNEKMEGKRSECERDRDIVFLCCFAKLFLHRFYFLPMINGCVKVMLCDFIKMFWFSVSDIVIYQQMRRELYLDIYLYFCTILYEECCCYCWWKAIDEIFIMSN